MATEPPPPAPKPWYSRMFQPILRMSNSETSGVVGLTVAGAGLALAYGLGTVFLKQGTRHTQLDPEVENMEKCPVLVNILLQLAEFRHLNENAYRAIVIDADNLAGLVRSASVCQLKYKHDEMAFMYFQDAMDYAKSMEEDAKAQHQMKMAVQIKSLRKQLYPELQTLFRKVHAAVYFSDT